MLRIRDMQYADREALVSLGRAMHAEGKYEHIPFDPDYTMHFLTHCLTDPRNKTLVVTSDIDEVIGVTSVTLMPYFFTPGFTGIDTVTYVKPEYRHTGAFRMLVEEAESWARFKGAHSMMFGLTAPHDPVRASRAYKKLGYQQWGVFLRKEFTP